MFSAIHKCFSLYKVSCKDTIEIEYYYTFRRHQNVNSQSWKDTILFIKHIVIKKNSK